MELISQLRFMEQTPAFLYSTVIFIRLNQFTLIYILCFEINIRQKEDSGGYALTAHVRVCKYITISLQHCVSVAGGTTGSVQ